MSPAHTMPAAPWKSRSAGGSGTTAAVAEKFGRRWIAADLSRFAIHTTRKRLLAIPGVRPFVVQNLGKYERQVWPIREFEGRTRVSRVESGVSPDSSPTPIVPAEKSAETGFRRDAENSRRDARAPQTEFAARQRAYIEFILRLYQATPVRGYTWLHGVSVGGGRPVKPELLRPR